MQSERIRRHQSGVTVLYALDQQDAEIWEDFRELREEIGAAFALICFSHLQFSANFVRKSVAKAVPGMRYAACSTAGEISFTEAGDGGLIIILFPAAHFTVQSLGIEGASTAGMESIVAQVAEAKRNFFQKLDHPKVGQRAFALCLLDGLSFAEEAITAAFHWGLDDVPLIGGSAGDDLNFVDTSMILDGQDVGHGAILLLFMTDLPFHIFKSDNFSPTQQRLVVTRSDPDRRIVYEFNAAPAAEEYARTIGMDAEQLSPMSFASHPLVVKVGGEYYCRSVQKMNPDHSLSFFCAIDDGIVLTVAEPIGMRQSTQNALDVAAEAVGGIDFVLGFECVLRRIDASNRQISQQLSEVYRKNKVAGFNTYGEQYHSMHLNQTFTGIAFAAEPQT